MNDEQRIDQQLRDFYLDDENKPLYHAAAAAAASPSR